MPVRPLMLLVMVLAAASGLLLPGQAAAAEPAVPLLLPTQGRLLDVHDQPVTGEQTLRFSIHDSPSPGAAEPAWSAAIQLQLKNGVYMAVLGDTAAGQPPLRADLFDGTKSRWLGVAVGAGPVMQPMLRIGSVPHAVLAGRALKADSADRAARADEADFALDAEVAQNALLLGGETPESYRDASQLTGVVPPLALGSGSPYITTLGTITTGTWQGTPIADAKVASASTWNAKLDRVALRTTQSGLRGDGKGTPLYVDFGSGEGQVAKGSDVADINTRLGAKLDRVRLASDTGLVGSGTTDDPLGIDVAALYDLLGIDGGGPGGGGGEFTGVQTYGPGLLGDGTLGYPLEIDFYEVASTAALGLLDDKIADIESRLDGGDAFTGIATSSDGLSGDGTWDYPLALDFDRVASQDDVALLNSGLLDVGLRVDVLETLINDSGGGIGFEGLPLVGEGLVGDGLNTTLEVDFNAVPYRYEFDALADLVSEGMVFDGLTSVGYGLMGNGASAQLEIDTSVVATQSDIDALTDLIAAIDSGFFGLSVDDGLEGDGTSGNPVRVNWDEVQSRIEFETLQALLDLGGYTPVAVTFDGGLQGTGTSGDPLEIDFSKVTLREDFDFVVNRLELGGFYGIVAGDGLLGNGTELSGDDVLRIDFTRVASMDALDDLRADIGAGTFGVVVDPSQGLEGEGTFTSPLKVVFGDYSGSVAAGDDPRFDHLEDTKLSEIVLWGEGLSGKGNWTEPLQLVFGQIAGTVAAGDDPRFEMLAEGKLEAVTVSTGLTGDGTPYWPIEVEFGQTSGTVAAGDDWRFDDLQLNKLDAVAVGAGVAGDGTTHAPLTLIFGTDAGTAAEGNDPRFDLIDTKLDEVWVGEGLKGLGTSEEPLYIDFGQVAGTVVEGNDPRFEALDDKFENYLEKATPIAASLYGQISNAGDFGIGGPGYAMSLKFGNQIQNSNADVFEIDPNSGRIFVSKRGYILVSVSVGVGITMNAPSAAMTVSVNGTTKARTQVGPPQSNNGASQLNATVAWFVDDYSYIDVEMVGNAVNRVEPNANSTLSILWTAAPEAP